MPSDFGCRISFKLSVIVVIRARRGSACTIRLALLKQIAGLLPIAGSNDRLPGRLALVLGQQVQQGEAAAEGGLAVAARDLQIDGPDPAPTALGDVAVDPAHQAVLPRLQPVALAGKLALGELQQVQELDSGRAPAGRVRDRAVVEEPFRREA